MKKIKEGLTNEEIVRRYPGSNNNGGNNIVDKGKGGGPRSHDMEKKQEQISNFETLCKIFD